MHPPLCKIFDLAIAWNWEYDIEFIEFIERIARSSGITTYLIHPDNVSQVIEKLHKNKLYFRVLLDRASDTDDAFEPLARFAAFSRINKHPRHRTIVINPYELTQRAADKATMHLEFLTNHIDVPYTLIVSPYNYEPNPPLSPDLLHPLGKPFIIKPANTTGGGIGVVLDAKTLHDVLEARKNYENDKYLLQELIKPVKYNEHKAWFRVFYAFGKIIPCWWEKVPHIFKPVTQEEILRFNLQTLYTTTQKIHLVCKLHFFSTEIAFTDFNKYVVVDYVNEMCDMRLQSNHPDGVPDSVVEDIIRSMIDFVRTERDKVLPTEYQYYLAKSEGNFTPSP